MRKNIYLLFSKIGNIKNNLVFIVLLGVFFINNNLLAQTVTTNPSTIGQGAYRVLYLKINTTITDDLYVTPIYEASFGAFSGWSETFTMTSGTNVKTYYVVFESVTQWNSFIANPKFYLTHKYCGQTFTHLEKFLALDGATGIIKTDTCSHYQKPLLCKGNQHPFTSFFNIQWGYSPPKPSLFSVAAKTNDGEWKSTSKITTSETVQFNVFSTGFNFNIEKSINGGANWTTIKTNVRSGSIYTVNDWEDLIDYSGLDGVKKIMFRAKTYSSTNTIVGKSYGYIIQNIEVYPKPIFSIDNEYSICSGSTLDTILISGIEIHNTVQKVNVSIINSNNQIDFSTILEGSCDREPCSYQYNTEEILFTNLKAGDYTIVFENWIRNSNEDLYPSGHNIIPFTIHEKPNLADCLLKSITRGCQVNEEIKITTNVPLPEKITFTYELYDNNNNPVSNGNVGSGGKVNVTYPGDSIIANIKYNNYPQCQVNQSIPINYLYPKIDFDIVEAIAICSYNDSHVGVSIVNKKDLDYEFKIGNSTFTDIINSIKVDSTYNYDITVRYKDKTTCSVTENYHIELPIAINFTQVVVNHVTVCDANSNGKINVYIEDAYANSSEKFTVQLISPSGATTSSTYSSTPRTKTFSNLAPGKYVIKVIDGKGCWKTDSVTINNVTNPFAIDEIITNDPTCNNPNNNGSITIKTTGQKKEISKVRKLSSTTWYSFDGIKTFLNLSSGTYNYIVMPDGFEKCSLSVSDTLAKPDPFPIDYSVVQPSCNNSQGEVTLLESPNSHSIDMFYQYSVYNGWVVLENNPVYLNPGSHKFTGKDENGCFSSTLNVLIDPKPSIEIENVKTIDPICYGGFGSVTFNVIGGVTQNYTFEIDGQSISSDSSEVDMYYTKDSNGLYEIHNIPAKFRFCLSVNEGTLCSDSECFLFIRDPIPINFDVTIDDKNGFNIDCNGGTTQIKTEISYGNPSYDIEIYKFDSNTGYYNNFEGYNVDKNNVIVQPDIWFSSGKYRFVITDSIGCEAVKDIEITEPNPLSLNVSNIVNPTCSNSLNGSFDININGGVNNFYLYSLDSETDEDTLQGNFNDNQIHTISGIGDTDLYLFIEDANGCRYPKDLGNYIIDSLRAPDPFSFTETSINPTCKERNDGKIFVSITGRENQEKVIKIKGNFIDAQYSTPLDNFDFPDLEFAEGSYTITVFDEKGCFDEKIVTLIAPPALTYSLTPQNLTCKGDSSGEIKVNIEGGTKDYSLNLRRDNEDISFDSQISSSQKTFSNINPGIYSIILSDANGCEVTPIGKDTVIISEPEEYLNMVLDSIPVRCYGESSGSITAIAQYGWGNYTFKLDTSRWSLVADTLTFTNQKIGDYVVFVKDSMGCTISDTITVTQPDTLKVEDIILSPVSCYGGNNGAISILPVGGNGGYTFDFGEGFSENSDITNLIAGEYNFTIEDSKECKFIGSTTVPQPEQFNLSKTPGNYNSYNIRCFGFVDSVSLQLTGGTAPYSYLLTDTLGTLYHSKLEFNNEEFVADNLPAGKYLLDFTDSNNCPFTESITLSQPEKLEFDTIFLIQPNCFGSPDGHIELTGMHGGVSEFKFNLTTFTNQYDSTHTGNSVKFWNLASDTLFISVLDDNSCSIDTSLVLNQPQPVSAKFNVNPVICKGDSNGSISVQLSGGTGSYEQTWYDSDSIQLSTSQFIDSKAAGTYLFRASDLNGCKAIDPVLHNDIFNIEIPEPENPLSIEVESITSTRCFGESNGEIAVNSTGGWNNHVYAVDNGDIDYTENSVISNLKAGDYAVFLRDSAGCVVSADVTVSQPDSLILSADLIGDVTCFGENSGFVNLSATGGNSDYLYSVNSEENQESNTFQSLAAGFYNFFVTDKLGCENYLDITINQPEQINYSLSKLVQPICGGNQGELEILPLGGTSPTSVEWLSHQLPNEFNVTNLQSGNYTFKLTDLNGCNRSFTEILNDIDGPTVEIVRVVNPTCSYRNDGSIEISVSGGTEPNTISWIGNDQNFGDEAILHNLSSGTYLANVTDLNGCFASVSANLSAPVKISYSSSSSPVSCFGTSTGSVSTQISGGTSPYSVNWFNNDNQNIGTGISAESLPAGRYFMSVKDKNGCGINSDSDTISQNIVVNQPQEPLQALISQIIKPKCFGDSNAKVTLSGKGGWSSYKYSLDGNSFTDLPVFSNLSAGNGQGFVKDKYGCIAEIDYEISQPNQLNHYVTDKSEVKCNGESNGWVSVETVGGTIPYSYSMNSGESWTNQKSFFGLSKGNYTILAKDINNCTSSISFDIEEPESLQVSMSNITSTYCGTANGQIVLSALGGTEPYTVYWSHLDKPWGLSVSELLKGNYSATILDANGCSESIDLEMPEIDGPKIDNFSIFSPLCNESDDGQINVDFTGISKPFRYFLNDTEVDSSFINGLVKGDYTFKVTDKFGCADEQLINLPAPEPIEIEFSSAVNPVCFGYSNGSISSLVSGGTSPYIYHWSNSSENTNLNNIPAGNYVLTVTDFHNCTQSATVSLYDPEQMETYLPEEVNLCIDQSVTLNAENPGCLYWWTSTNSFESNEQEVTLSDDGWYYLQVTNSKGCFVTDTVHVKQHNYAVDATLLVPSIANKNDTIVVVDISWPIPDSLYWEIPSDFTVLFDSPYEKHIKAQQEGLYDIKLVTYVGECSAFNEKSIDIDKDKSVELQKVEVYDIIKSVSLAPNPASHITRIGVNLSIETDITIDIYSGFGVKVLGKKLSGSDSYSLQLPLKGLSPGMYMVKVSALNSYKTVKLMVE